MYNSLYRRYIGEMRLRVSSVFGVIDSSGLVLACSSDSQTGSVRSGIPFHSSTFLYEGSTYRMFQQTATEKWYVFVDGADEKASLEAELLAGSLEAILAMTDEKDDTNEFVRQIAARKIDNAILYDRLKALHIRNPADRYVCVIHSSGMPASELYNIVDSLMTDRGHDFIYSSEHQNVVLVKEALKEKDLSLIKDEMEKTAKKINRQYRINLQIGIGLLFQDMHDLPEAFQQADAALYACNAFDPVRTVVRYDRMGIAGLVSKLSEADMRQYLHEMFTKEQWDSLDQELIFTIRKFFENDLSVTDTSRQLYINRNSLIYRLNKIEKNTGFDLRRLDDAMAVKMVLMIQNYMNAQKKQED
jgi:carbohydrate diacid regulator